MVLVNDTEISPFVSLSARVNKTTGHYSLRSLAKDSRTLSSPETIRIT